MRSRILWTVLPNASIERSYRGQKRVTHLRLSVLASPQLEVEGLPARRLGEAFPDFVDWPRAVAAIRFSLELGAPGSVVTFSEESAEHPLLRQRVTPPRALRNLWAELFGPRDLAEQRTARTEPPAPEPGLSSFKFTDFSHRGIFTFPASESSSERDSDIRRAAFTVDRTTSRMNPLEHGHGAMDVQTLDELSRVVEEQLAGQKVLSRLTAPHGIEEKAWLAARAHVYRRVAKAKRDNWYAGTLKDPKLDFHEMLFALGAYPVLMRYLGLILDFEVPLPDPSAIKNAGAVRIIPHWPKKQSDFVDVSLLTAYKWEAPDFLAASRADSYIRDGMLDLGRQTNGEPEFLMKQLDLMSLLLTADDTSVNEDGLTSTLRSGGLSLLWRHIDSRMHDSFTTAAAHNAALEAGRSEEIVLHAEELTRGFCVDVRRLHNEREPWLSLCQRIGTYTVIRSGHSGTAQDEGWVTRSGSPVDFFVPLILTQETLWKWEGWSLCAPRPGKPVGNNSSLASPDSGTVPENRLRVAFEAATRTLPTLRFGRSYRARVLVVDLAGNRIPRDRADRVDPTAYSEPVTFWRFEPVRSPVAVLRRPLVDQTGTPYPGTEGEALDHLVIRSNPDTPIIRNTERHLAPSQVGQTFAELHGVFDERECLDEDAYNRIAERDGELPTVWDDDHLPLSYLPDPLCARTSLRGLPGTSAPVYLEFLRSSRAYPDMQSWRIILTEDPPDPDLSAPGLLCGRGKSPHREGNVLTIYLPKAEVATVDVSAILQENELRIMGLWNWVNEAFPNEAAVFTKLMSAGEHPMVTPSLHLTLVHAVRRPLIPPRYVSPHSCDFMPAGELPQPERNPANLADADDAQILIHRELGDTSAHLHACIAFPGKSASQLGIYGAWRDLVDSGSGTPAWVSQSAQAFSRPVEPAQDAVIAADGLHQFGDTKHRVVEYTAVATTRFRKYFPPGGQASDFTQTSVPTHPLHVPSTAPPAKPEIELIIPTFGWAQPSTPQRTSRGPIERRRRRVGGGLRFYLKRPWGVSGSDEQLGVIALPHSGASAGLNLQFVSRWGWDPVRVSKGVDRELTEKDFAGAVRTRRRIDCPEAGGEVVVVGYGVEDNFDPESGLWYCDLAIDPDEFYFPFVKLAVVRFQPHSVSGAHLSPVVLADFQQLAPHREAIVTLDPLHPQQLQVKLTGKAFLPENVVEISIEAMDWHGRFDAPPVDDAELLWRSVSGGPYRMRLVAGDQTYWEAEAPLPVQLGEGALRVLVREYERVNTGGNEDRRLVYLGIVYL